MENIFLFITLQTSTMRPNIRATKMRLKSFLFSSRNDNIPQTAQLFYVVHRFFQVPRPTTFASQPLTLKQLTFVSGYFRESHPPLRTCNECCAFDSLIVLCAYVCYFIPFLVPKHATCCHSLLPATRIVPFFV